jgi:hypothetical protein
MLSPIWNFITYKIGNLIEDSNAKECLAWVNILNATFMTCRFNIMFRNPFNNFYINLWDYGMDSIIGQTMVELNFLKQSYSTVRMR